MRVEVNGTRLWFDVDGPALVPAGAVLRDRPTVVLIHGGPGTYDHSYFKPDFGALTRLAQVVYLDLRDHGRSARHDAADWSFETCADDVDAFCEALGIERPIIFGHSMGGIVAMLSAARHRGRAGGLILQSTFARFDLARLAAGFRRVAGDEIARLAERDFGGHPVGDAEWTRVFAAYGPAVPDADQLARRIANPAVAEAGMDRLRALDVVDQLARIDCPTLVCVGALDPVTPVEASREIVENLSPGVGRLEVIDGAGHFPWIDAPARYWPLLESFIAGC
ncbi:MAG TPA: alpha/beta hydrolase [Candidatus Limnocylindrales bacterium]|nr:alpha/beta hydrolase [Candidatus Limnocylindrales bacterium]